MEISLIAAVDEDMGLGRNGSIPWHHASDMRFFREKTNGCALIIGRETWLSLPAPLYNRTFFVVSSRLQDVPRGTFLTRSIEEAMNKARDMGFSRIYGAGGQRIYEAMFPYASDLFLTRIPGIHNCTTIFPPIPAEWSTAEVLDQGSLRIERWKNPAPYGRVAEAA